MAAAPARLLSRPVLVAVLALLVALAVPRGFARGGRPHDLAEPTR